MSRVTIIWSAASGACLMLMLMHLFVWSRDRRSWANLCFSAMVSGVIGLEICEMVTMSTDSPELFGRAIQWTHLIYAMGVAGSLGFVHFSFGTGTRGLLALALGLRFLAVVANFTTGANLHILSIKSLGKTIFFGEQVSILGEWSPNPWVRLGWIATLVQLAYVVDASLRLWRLGSPELRRRALVVGGALLVFIAFAAINAGLVAAGVWRMPLIVSFPFLGVLLVMGYELSGDVLRASQLARELREGEMQRSLAAEAASLGIWTRDLERNEIWANEGWRSLFGFTSSDRLTHSRIFERLHSEDRDAVIQTFAQVAANGGAYETEYRVVLPDGRLRWIASRGRSESNNSGKPILVRGVSLDITARKQAEERFRLVIEAAPNAIVMIDSEGRIVLVNAQTESVFGYSRAELVGQPIEILIPDRFRDRHPPLRQGYHSHPAARVMGAGLELFGLRQDGTEVPVEIGLNPIHAWEGKFVLASIIDISSRKHAEREAERHRRELAHLSRVSVLGELAGAIAHELNQPLAAMLSNSQVGSRSLALGSPDMDEMSAIFDDIAADAKRAGGIIHGMRAMFKKDAALEAHPLSLNEAISQAFSLLHGEIVGRKVHVTLTLGDNLPDVFANRVEIQQVLINLILNSLDALRESASAPRIDITTTLDDKHVVVSVCDNGPGIPAEMMDRVFERFATTKPGGLGLGPRH